MFNDPKNSSVAETGLNLALDLTDGLRAYLYIALVSAAGYIITGELDNLDLTPEKAHKSNVIYKKDYKCKWSIDVYDIPRLPHK